MYEKSWKPKANQRDLCLAVARAMKALKGTGKITKEAVAQRVKSYGIATVAEALNYLEVHGLPTGDEQTSQSSYIHRPDRLVTHGPSFKGR